MNQRNTWVSRFHKHTYVQYGLWLISFALMLQNGQSCPLSKVQRVCHVPLKGSALMVDRECTLPFSFCNSWQCSHPPVHMLSVLAAEQIRNVSPALPHDTPPTATLLPFPIFILRVEHSWQQFTVFSHWEMAWNTGCWLGLFLCGEWEPNHQSLKRFHLHTAASATLELTPSTCGIRIW